jgi:hypothetical protein
MNEQVLLLSTKMVQTVMGFLDDTPNLETKLSVIETLRTVTEGKVSGIVALSAIRHTNPGDRSLSKSSELA